MHRHTAAEFSSSTKPKPAPSVIQPPGGLTVIETSMPILSPNNGTLPGSSDPEDTVTPQLPAVASTRIQAADQRRESAPNSDNASSNALLKELNSKLNKNER